MTEKMKNILIGLFVVSAITIMISMILFLEPKIGDGKQSLRVRFANIAGISLGTRVTFAGKPVGEVISIEEVKDARTEPSDETGRVYLYQLTLKVDSSVEVYNTDEIAIRTTGLMGEKSIAILPKIAQKGKLAHLVNQDILFANSIDPLENTFNQISRTSNRLEGAIAHFDTWFTTNDEALTQTVGSLQRSLSKVDSLLTAVEEADLIPSVRQSTALLNDNLRSIRESLQDDQLLQKFSHLASNLNDAVNTFNADGADALRHLNQVSRDLAQGTGTIGKLISGEEFYLRMNSLFSKAETLMNDVNHYGLLFQYDKHWQRSRTKRSNLLKSLDSPKEFRTYFEGEIDTINTSLGRLTELLERSDSIEEKEKIASNPDFKRQFASLLRSSQSLFDSIKLYNEGLITDASKD